MSPSFCTFLAELHGRGLKGREQRQRCVYALGCSTLLTMGLALKQQHFCGVPVRSYFLSQLLSGYSWR